MKLLWVLLVLVVSSPAFAGLRAAVGQGDLADWQGVARVEDGGAVAEEGGVLAYSYANQQRVYFPGIKRDYFGDSADWSEYQGVALEIHSASDSPSDIHVTLKVDPQDANETHPVSTAVVRIAGAGWHEVYVPWAMFELDAGQREGTLLAIKRVELSARSADATPHRFRNVYVTRGRAVALQARQQGKASDAGTVVEYAVEVGNTTDRPQAVQLRVVTQGWESMPATLEPAFVDLEPGQTQTCRLRVSIPKKLPAGLREKQVVHALANGEGAASAALTFVTAVRLPTPNIMFSADGWQAIRDKAHRHAWAQKGFDAYVAKADRWDPPAPRDLVPDAQGTVLGQSIFRTDGRHLFNCAIAYQLTGNAAYVEKCLAVIRPLVSETAGYPATLVGGGDSFVAEGKFWQAVGRAYDLIRDSPQVTDEDRRQVEETFRLFAARTIKGNTRGAISNWNIAEINAAFYCAMNLQDWHLIDQLVHGPTGIYKHLEHGVMNDGWWYECSVGYNRWVATQFSEVALALEPWGINFKNKRFALGATRHFSLLASRRKGGVYGMAFEKWGKIERNSVGIKDMWDATVPFLDYRGVVPAVNDALDEKVSGKPYELAYALYGDPEYAAVVQRGNNRDLLYGVADLPEVTSEKMSQSAYADNMGIVQLRSQAPERPLREQIQAMLHYGSHGGFHGHFDRTGLVNMARYGRSFYGPLMYWYGYGSYLYKHLKQTSTTKNMVVVDEKMQEPVENDRILFYTGQMMQATAIETVSRWSYPPYGGIVYDPDVTFSEKMWEEGRSIPVPEDAPEYGACTAYTAPVIQRRAMVMLDDYVVLADFLQGETDHQFDWMFQVKGFKGLEADQKKHLRHTAQMNDDPLGSTQFVTDCDWYQTQGTARSRFEMHFGEQADNAGVRLPHSEPGVLKIDLHHAWPREQEIMIGTAPASFKVNKKVWYGVAGDGEVLLEGKTGAWILGSQDLDVDVAGVQVLTLTTKVDNTRNNTLFWGDARVVLKDGSEVLLSEIGFDTDNIARPDVPGRDYYGGPIKIGGERMDHALPAMPLAADRDATVVIDLSGVEAVRFKARVGGDFPMGDESHRLKTLAVRTHGAQARFLSVVEPYEAQRVIKSVTATSAEALRVELLDGRVQEIVFSGLDHAANDSVRVHVRELRDGQVVREEQTD